MRISDWSSDVCSSDLFGQAGIVARPTGAGSLPLSGVNERGAQRHIRAAEGAPVSFRGAQRDQRETGPVPPDDLLEMGGGCAPDAGLAQPIPPNRGATNRFTAPHPAFRLCHNPPTNT